MRNLATSYLLRGDMHCLWVLAQSQKNVITVICLLLNLVSRNDKVDCTINTSVRNIDSLGKLSTMHTSHSQPIPPNLHRQIPS